MPAAVIVSALRTPIGTAMKGTLRDTDAYQLAEHVVSAAAADLDSASIDDVILGEGLYGGGVVARHAAITAGLTSVPGLALNRHCAAGQAAVQSAAASIRAGMDKLVLAGGVNSASTSPRFTRRAGSHKDAELVDWFPPTHPDRPDAPNMDMSITVGWNAAVKAGVSREEMDEWALGSHRKAIRAIDEGRFKHEIVPGCGTVNFVQMTIDELIEAARNGSTRAAGKLLSLVESPRRDEVLDALGATTTPRIVGVTGPPGAGKSTTVGALVGAYRERGMRVAVLAVDPSSPYSGGALLGDRIRMAAHINDSDVLIRSVATRGHLGGLAAAVPAATRLLAALSYDLIVLETVGVGQSEIEIAAVADPTVVILNPGAGDAVQAAKAGLLEVADIVVVNKADREGADQTVRDLRAETKAPILKLVAAEGEGIPELVGVIEDHHRTDSPERRMARARAQILSLAQTQLRSHPELDRLAELVADRRSDPYSAAEQLFAVPVEPG